MDAEAGTASDEGGDAVLDRYRMPSQRVLDKVIDRLDEHCTAFIRLAPFAVLASASPDGRPDGSRCPIARATTGSTACATWRPTPARR
jgi:predicted pyridoxine 5'-phosphate oxidase superfamily flavin-nucleotide-binding protein